MFNNKSLLITGGTGSFGKAFVKHLLAHYNPRRVIVYSRDELKQSEMQQEINDPRMRFFIGDVRDAERLRTAFHDVDYVVHAAALKQIPAAEYNPMECIKTNIMGAQNVINMALAQGVKKVVALSTDKAASPINLYGATKLAADKLFVAANSIVGSRDARFAVVRYGNVMGSRGSVIPLYQRLVREGKTELPVTDVRMTRFWITLEQGVQFVLNTFARMHGGEIFVPKLPSAKILEMVKAISATAKPNVIGIRPGEKLHELMITKDDARMTIEFGDHYVIKPGTVCSFQANYDVNGLQEVGKPVEDEFEYSSDSNTWFLAANEIAELIQHVDALQMQNAIA